MRHIVMLTAGADETGVVVAPPTGINRSPSGTIIVRTSAAVGDVVADLALVGGLGTGTWSEPSGFADLDMVPATGRTSELRVAAALDAGDVGTRSVVVHYTGEGLATPLSHNITLDIRLPVASPTDITSDKTYPIVVQQSHPINTKICTLSLVGGNGTGTWSKTAGSSKFVLSGTGPGLSSVDVNLGSNALTATDVGTGFTLTVQYSGDGLATPLTETITYNVTATVSPPVVTVPATITLDNTANTGDLVLTASVAGGAGNGTWNATSTVTPSLALARTVSGRTATWRLGRNLTASDNTTNATVTVTYTETGYSTITKPIPLTIKAPGVGPGWRSGFTYRGDSDNASGTGVPTVSREDFEAWLNRPVPVMVQFTGAKTSEWNNIATTNGGQWWAIRNNIAAGVMHVISLPVATQNAIQSNGLPGFQAIIDGDYNTQINALGDRLREAVTVNSVVYDELLVLRLGWEQTLELSQFPPWSIRGLNNSVDPARIPLYKDAFNHVASLLKAKIGSQTRADFCVQKDYTGHGYPIKTAGGANIGQNITNAGSPDTWVWNIVPSGADIVSVDQYDSSPYAQGPLSIGSDNYDAWVWKMRNVFLYAVYHGKLFAVDEWGLRNKLKREKIAGSNPAQYRYVLSGGADNPQAIAHYYKFFDWCHTHSVHPNKLLFESYFRVDEAHTTTNYPVQNDPNGAGAANSGTAHDPMHPLWWYDGGTPRRNTPWHGHTDGSVTGTGGAYVGQDRYNASGTNKATDLATAKYKELFGVPD